MEAIQQPKRVPPLSRSAVHVLLAIGPEERHGYAIMREIEPNGNLFLADVKPLEGLNNLYYLFLEGNKIRDLTPLINAAKKDSLQPSK